MTMKVLGVTGNIGSGKSYICSILAQLGLPYYNSDFRAKTIVNTVPEVQKMLKVLLSDKAYNEDGIFDRDYVAKLVLLDSSVLTKIEMILRQPVTDDLQMFISQHTDKAAICLESAVLLNHDFKLFVNATLLVTADMETKVARIKRRDAFRSDQEIAMLFQSQFTEADMRKLCQYEVHNVNKTKDQLTVELQTIVSNLTTIN